MDFVGHTAIILLLGAISGVITAVANSAFGQSWGALQFFLIWVILIVVSYGGFVIITDDDIF